MPLQCSLIKVGRTLVVGEVSLYSEGVNFRCKTPLTLKILKQLTLCALTIARLSLSIVILYKRLLTGLRQR